MSPALKFLIPAILMLLPQTERPVAPDAASVRVRALDRASDAPAFAVEIVDRRTESTRRVIFANATREINKTVVFRDRVVVLGTTSAAQMVTVIDPTLANNPLPETSNFYCLPGSAGGLLTHRCLESSPSA